MCYIGRIGVTIWIVCHPRERRYPRVNVSELEDAKKSFLAFRLLHPPPSLLLPPRPSASRLLFWLLLFWWDCRRFGNAGSVVHPTPFLSSYLVFGVRLANLSPHGDNSFLPVAQFLYIFSDGHGRGAVLRMCAAPSFSPPLKGGLWEVSAWQPLPFSSCVYPAVAGVGFNPSVNPALLRFSRSGQWRRPAKPKTVFPPEHFDTPMVEAQSFWPTRHVYNLFDIRGYTASSGPIFAFALITKMVISLQRDLARSYYDGYAASTRRCSFVGMRYI